MRPPVSACSISSILDPTGWDTDSTIIATARCRRRLRVDADGTEVVLDDFPDFPGVACGFVRLPLGPERTARLILAGVDNIAACAAGGWIIRPSQAAADAPIYWIPQPPVARSLDSHGRILSQNAAGFAGLGIEAGCLRVDIDVARDMHVDLTAWRLPPSVQAQDALTAPLGIEQQPLFLRSSHSVLQRIADLYLCLVHGHVYDNRFVWRRLWGGYGWRICSENEALSQYVALNGLERATGRPLYGLLKQQLLVSVAARQSPDGGWRHGEWTDLNESHFRLHNAGVQILVAALEEQRDPVIEAWLERAAAFSASCTDRTDLGRWFLHDSLEQSVEAATTRGAPPRLPTGLLGASDWNQWILNTHLDAIVTLDRFREVTADAKHVEVVDSARATARSILAARPAEWLYRLVYRAVRLTLLPAEGVRRLSLPARVVRRLAADYLCPRLYSLKWRFPRFVMPGGLLDRHLSPRHFAMSYHTVNLMDIVRVARRFPEDDYRGIVQGAIDAVTRNGLLRYWLESKQHQPLGYWVEAMYHLCTLDPSHSYRKLLAEAVLCAEEAGIGLPPALLGADPEAVIPEHQVPCPSPRDRRLRIANLSCGGKREFLVVNPAAEAIELSWDCATPESVTWANDDSNPRVLPRGWLLGRGG